MLPWQPEFQSQGFFRPILKTNIWSCSQWQKVCFFPISRKKFQLKGGMGGGGRNDKLSPFHGMFLFWKGASLNDTNSVTRVIIDDCTFF